MTSPRYLGLLLTTLLCAACGGGSSPTDPPVSEIDVLISGRVTYDYVPYADGQGLDYDAMEALPSKGLTVQLLDQQGVVAQESMTDEDGRYSIRVTRNELVRIRVLAKFSRSGDGPNWDFQVTDNTQGNALYVLDGELELPGNTDSIRDLHAGSGWNGQKYSDTRSAAPFAILDAVHQSLQHVLIAAPNVKLRAAELRWSTENIPVLAGLGDGFIGTSFYRPEDGHIYILGDENNDTDEYDRSVIQHEWAHYLEDAISRSDSIGGRHRLGGSYDMRLAYGEGFANAFSGITGDRFFYADTSGSNQSRGFRFSLESNNVGNAGWFNENAIGKILYDIADDENEGEDTLSLGMTPILQAMMSPSFIESDAMTSVYLMMQILKDQSDTSTQVTLDTLMLEQGIFGRGIYGEGETNDSTGNITFALPVYNTLSLDASLNVCGNNRQGEYNGLDVRRFIRINIPAQGSYTIRAEKSLGTGAKDPVVDVFRQGNLLARINNQTTTDREQGSVELDVGEHILEVYDALNTNDESDGGASCFDISVSAM